MPRKNATITREHDDELAVHAPRQQRTREQWRRVLDAGVVLLEQGGYEAFTIAALCERAAVPPRALYARAATKDALFMAVYEHGMSRVVASQDAFATRVDATSGGPEERIERAVRFMVEHFLEHADFLRAVVLISGAHPEVRHRGEVLRSDLEEVFARAVRGDAGTPDRSSVDFCFALVFSAMVVRVAYGPALGAPAEDRVMADEMVVVAQRYLA